MTLTKEQEDAFRAELTELTKKHGVVIHGCGCCGSPFLWGLPPEDREGCYIEKDGVDVQWSSPKRSTAK